MPSMLALFAAATAQLSIGGTTLRPADFLDGRTIASGAGAPVVMLTLTDAAAARVRKIAPDAPVTVDGKVAVARRGNNTIEIDGPTDFAAAAALARAISGKAPLPDSLEE